MNLKNYTSTVPFERTVARIEQLLAAFGASRIQKDYAGGEVAALRFALPLPGGGTVPVEMPVRAEAVFLVLREELLPKKPAAEHKLRQQSRRTAWKTVQDWVEVQLSLIRLGQADAAQVFLPYVVVGPGETFYDRLKGEQFKALPGPRDGA